MNTLAKRSGFLRRWIGDRAFYKMTLGVALPIMIQNGISTFVGLLDNIMVAGAGPEALTGVGVANQLLLVFNLSIFGSVSGAGIFGAQFFGKGDHNGVRSAMRFKLLIGTCICFLGALIFSLFSEPLIGLFLKGEAGTELDPASVLVNAKDYISILMISFIPFMLASSYAGTLRECGQTIVPMASGIASMVTNLVLNYLLINGAPWLGLPAMGLRGAAIATVIARTVECLIVMVWTHTHTKRCPFAKGLWRSFRIPRVLARDILIRTIPLAINETLWSGGMAVLQMCYSLRSPDVVLALTISGTVSNVFNVVLMAMGVSVGIIVGQQLGAGDVEKAKDSNRKLMLFSMMLCVAVGGVMALFAPILPAIFAQGEGAVHGLASGFIRISALIMPINSLTNCCYFTMRSGGKTFVTFLFDSCFVWVVTVPAAWSLNVLTALPTLTVYLLVQLTECIKAVFGIYMIRKGYWINNIVNDKPSA